LERVGLKNVGEQIIKWNVLIFFILLVSGIVLWAPVNMRFLGDVLKRSFRIKWGGTPAKRNYDMHSVAGFYAFAVMLMVAWTGIFWMFDSVEDSIYAAFGAKKIYEIKPPSALPAQKLPSSKKTAVIDRAHAEALRYGRPSGSSSGASSGAPALVSIQFPQKDTEALRILLRYPYRFIRKQSVFYFDQYAGTLIKSDLHENYTTPDKIRVSNFDLHTGRILGLPSKILWFFAAIFTASLPVTGTMLWWNKRTKKNRKKKRLVTKSEHTLEEHTPQKMESTSKVDSVSISTVPKKLTERA
jgi:uncharacterized iron-regulated membrane protein